jgi:hypothetical protein
MTKLRDLAKVCQRKNAGPFEVTRGAIFETRERFERVREASVLTARLFADMYGARQHAPMLGIEIPIEANESRH